MNKLILLTLTLGMIWVVGAQATDPPVFKYDEATGQYYYHDVDGTRVDIVNDMDDAAPTYDDTPPPDANTPVDTGDSSTTGSTGNTASGSTTDSGTTPSSGNAATGTDSTGNTTSSGTVTSGSDTTSSGTTTSDSGTSTSTETVTSGSDITPSGTTTSDSGTSTSTDGTTNSDSTGTTTDQTPTDSAATGETTPETTTESSTTGQITDATNTSTVTVNNVPDYADYWIKACPNYLTQIDLNADGQKVATVLSINESNNSQVTDNKNGTLSYIPNKDFTNGVDTLSITYQTPEGNTASAVIKARMECKEVLKPAACRVYISHNSGYGNTQFLTLDPEAGKAVTLGPLYRGYDIEGLAFNPKNRLLYGLSGGIFAPKKYRGELYLIDSATGGLSMVGNTGFPRLYGLTARLDGTLWAWAHTITAAKPGGILQIDPDTAISSLKFTSTMRIDHLAWSSDGKTLYGGYGKNLWAWKYDGTEFTPVIPKGATKQQPICKNLPTELEGLAPLQGNMLLFGERATKDSKNRLMVFNPLSCKVVLTYSFDNPDFGGKEKAQLDHSMEGIVWADDCQPDPKVATAEVQQFQDIEVCDAEAGWTTAMGKVQLTPSDSKAYVKTSWSIINPKVAQCPTETEGKTAPCESAYLSSQLVNHNEPFSVNVWWPGIASGKNTKVAVSVQVQDMDGNPLNEEVTHYLKSDGCNEQKLTREAMVKDYLAHLNGVDTFEYNYTENGMVATLMMGGQSKYRVEITPVEPASLNDEISGELNTSSLGSKDSNGFSPLVKLIFADGKRIEARFSQIHTITYKSALTHYLAQITADENIEFGTNGALTVSIDNEIYRGTLYPELTGGDLASKEVVFTAISDVDGNGNNDFTVKYADGTEQTLYIVSVPGSDDVVVEPIPTVEGEESPVVDDATDPVEPSEPSSSNVTEPAATTDNATDPVEPSSNVTEPAVTTDSATTVEPSATTDSSSTTAAEPANPVDTTETTVAPVQPTETVAPAVTSEPLVEVTPPVETAPVVVNEPAPVVVEPAPVVVIETPVETQQ